MDQMNPSSTPEMPKKEGGTGSVIAIIVIVVLLALGGIYYLMTSGNAMMPVNETMPTMEEVQNSNDPDVQATMQQGSSDVLADIEADMSSTDFGSLDAEINNLGE